MAQLLTSYMAQHITCHMAQLLNCYLARLLTCHMAQLQQDAASGQPSCASAACPEDCLRRDQARCSPQSARLGRCHLARCQTQRSAHQIQCQYRAPFRLFPLVLLRFWFSRLLKITMQIVLTLHDKPFGRQTLNGSCVKHIQDAKDT